MERSTAALTLGLLALPACRTELVGNTDVCQYELETPDSERVVEGMYLEPGVNPDTEEGMGIDEAILSDHFDVVGGDVDEVHENLQILVFDRGPSGEGESVEGTFWRNVDNGELLSTFGFSVPVDGNGDDIWVAFVDGDCGPLIPIWDIDRDHSFASVYYSVWEDSDGNLQVESFPEGPVVGQ